MLELFLAGITVSQQINLVFIFKTLLRDLLAELRDLVKALPSRLHRNQSFLTVSDFQLSTSTLSFVSNRVL